MAALNCAGELRYKFNTYNSGYNPTLGFVGFSAYPQLITFADTGTSSGGQLFANQHFENDATVSVAHAANTAALFWNAKAKYLLQPTLNSPDYTQNWECGAKRGTYGNILICFNDTDGPQSQTFNLSPYLESGQQIERYILSDTSIAYQPISAGTMSDAVSNVPPLNAVAYVFPVNFSAEIAQPSVAVCITATSGCSQADVPSATAIAIRWSYDPYYIDALGTTYSCGTNVCTPPWDRNIGTIWYRIVYLDSSNRVLAMSDIQTF
jgi:hypothetical protein